MSPAVFPGLAFPGGRRGPATGGHLTTGADDLISMSCDMLSLSSQTGNKQILLHVAMSRKGAEETIASC